ncbi:MAG: aminoacyl-tRNA hydrolase [Lachnospiraceae bacterium]|nr:aminoacyl-tRNA hydrolase [Lachnospiraceae bacterium]
MFGNRKGTLPSGVTHIVVGLGNPDKKYENTRHNAGFITVDAFAEKHGTNIDRLKYKSLCSAVSIGDKKVLLMKPQTYMNNSGEAVVEAMNFYKIPPENVIIIFDDISLDVGLLRVKRKGSDGGQKGMRSIIYLSGSDNFPRVKIGIGHKPEKWDLADWVLSQFSTEDKKLLNAVTEKAIDAVELMLNGDIDKAMNRYN